MIQGSAGFGQLGCLLVSIGTLSGVGSLAVPALFVREVVQKTNQVRTTLKAPLLLVVMGTATAIFIGLVLMSIQCVARFFPD